MNDKRYIFFDIDGTLVDEHGEMPESTYETLKLLQKNNHEIFICSGRAPNLLPKILKDLNFNGLVCGTGSYVEYKNNTVYQLNFNESQVERVINEFVKHKMIFLLSTKNETVLPDYAFPVFIELFTQGKIKAKDCKNLTSKEFPPLEIIEPYILDNNLKDYYKNHKEIFDFIFIKSDVAVSELNDILGPDLHVEKASFKNPDDFSGEITLECCTKATGIDRLLKHLNIDKKNTISIGDSYNDVDMLNFTELSIAMGNSPKDIKDIADLVTEDIKDDGLFKAFKNLKLI